MYLAESSSLGRRRSLFPAGIPLLPIPPLPIPPLLPARGVPPPTIASVPTPGRFYRIRKGDNLLKVAGRAYGVGKGPQRLDYARWINDAQFNRRFWRPAPKGERKWFPDGRISFSPRFTCDVEEQLQNIRRAPAGKCFAVLWIPGPPT